MFSQSAGATLYGRILAEGAVTVAAGATVTPRPVIGDCAALRDAIDVCIGAHAGGHCPDEHGFLIGDWDVTGCTDMSGMFYEFNKRPSFVSFNADISNWDVSKVTNMWGMFIFSTAFNGDLSDWDVSRVTDMVGMFGSAEASNADVSAWDVSKVTNMDYMFYSASAFNGDLSDWDVSKVTNMDYMLFASAFSQTLCNAWLSNTGSSKTNMFQGTTGAKIGSTAECAALP